MIEDRIRNPNIPKSITLITAAEQDMKYVLNLHPKIEAAATIIRGIYESFRMLGEAVLVFRGIETTEHTVMIGALTSLEIKASRPLGVLDNLRRLRHDINYRAYRPSMAELEDAILIAQTLFDPLRKEVIKLVQQKGFIQKELNKYQ